MDKQIQLFRDNMQFMADKLEEHAQDFRKLEESLAQFPDEAYKLIPEKQKKILFSSFINLDKQIRNIKSEEIKKLLNKLTEELYGLNGGKNRRKLR